MSMRNNWMILHLTVLVAGCGLGGLTTISQQAQIDEQMSRFEQAVPNGPSDLFKTMDLNADGAIARDEFIAALDKMPPPPPRHDASASEDIKPDPNQFADCFFSEADTNKDGKVTLEEMQAMRPPHDHEDLDGPRPGRHHHRMPPSPEELFKHFDQNGDGFLTQEEMATLPDDCPPPPPMRPEFASGSIQASGSPSFDEMAKEFIAKHDADKDGKVSLADFKATMPTPPARP